MRNLLTLQSVCTFDYRALKARKFVVSSTGKPFSSIPLDQANELNNETVTGIGGISGLAPDPLAIKRLMIVAPEMSTMTEEFRNVKEQRTTEHNEMGLAFQKRLRKTTKHLVNTLIQ